MRTNNDHRLRRAGGALPEHDERGAAPVPTGRRFHDECSPASLGPTGMTSRTSKSRAGAGARPPGGVGRATRRSAPYEGGREGERAMWRAG